MNRRDLFAKDNKGKIRIWSIWKDGNYLKLEYGLLDGLKIEDSIPVFDGLAGRTQNEQMELVANSRINSKLDSGYCLTLEDAKNNMRTNALGLFKPMLAQKFSEKTNLNNDTNHYIQYKYDGHRCILHNRGGEMLAYSRNGKIITTLDHIIGSSQWIPEGAFLDGELYVHGIPLQKITSLVKKYQVESSTLKFICYDMIENKNYSWRLDKLKELSKDFPNKVELARTILLEKNVDIKEELDLAIENGFEGIIVRNDGFNYEHGKRSKSLLKVKRWMDMECEVYDISSTVDGFARLHCIARLLIARQPVISKFKVTCHGDYSYKRHVLLNKQNYIGRKANIQYAGLTVENKPFHPVSTMWRDAHDE